VPGGALAGLIAFGAVSLVVIALWLVAARAASRPRPARPAVRDDEFGGGHVHPLHRKEEDR
jgi:hypothetical protein